MFGYLHSGFIRKKLVAMRNEMYNALWDKKPGIDLSDDSLPAILLQIVMLELSLLWQAAEAIFYSRYVGTARGVALDHLGARLFLPRQGEKRAIGTLAVSGPNGRVLSRGTRIRHADGTEFALTRTRTINAAGVCDIEVEAIRAGPSGNKAVGGEWYITGEGNIEVSGLPATHTFETFEKDIIEGFDEIPVGDRWDTLQEVAVADLNYPITLDLIRFRVKNMTSEPQLYWIYCECTDKATGTRLGDTQVKRLTLLPGSEIDLAFSGQAWDVSEREIISISFIVGHGSTGPIGIGVNRTAPYRGGFRLAGVPLPSTDAWLQIETQALGYTRHGALVEHDVMYSRRQREAMARAATSIPDAIHANLWAIEGVRHVRVDYNPTLIIDELGLEPKSVRATVSGGKVREIGQMLLSKCVAAGIATCGSDMIGVPCPTKGQTIPIRFERPSEVPVYVVVRVVPERGGVLPDDIAIKIKDAITFYIGGPLSSGTYAAGIGPGENVSVSHIHAAVVKFGMISTATVWLSRTPLTKGELDGQDGKDLVISKSNPVEIAVTCPEWIEVF